MENEIVALKDRIGRLNAMLEALQRITQLISYAANLNQVLDEVMKLTIGLVDAQAGIIILIDPTTGEISAHTALSEHLSRETAKEPEGWKLDKGAMGAILKIGEPVIIPDLSQYPLFRQEMCKAVGIEVMHILCVPLKGREKTFGILQLFNKRSGHGRPDATRTCFSEEDLKVIVSLSNEITMVIENALIVAKLERKIVELDNLLKGTEAIASTLELNVLLDIIMELGIGIMDAEGCSVLLIDEERRKLQFVAASGAKKEQLKEMSLNLGEGIAGWVAENGEGVLIEDVSRDERFSRRIDETLGQRTRSLICVPLKVKEKIIGVMEVINKRGGKNFTGEDMVLFKSLSAQVALAIERARLYEDLEDMYISTVKSLAEAIDANDPYTRGHSERVTKYALLIARELGFDEKSQRKIQICALLHDVGKIGVPVAVLRKKDKLSDEDWKLIRRHPVLGAEIISPVRQLQELVPPIRHHHERYDGEGYPDNLKGEEIPLMSRIIAVADTFDALTSDRPYRSGLSFKAAIEEIESCKGTQLDPVCTDAFLRAYQRELPIEE